MEKKGYPVEAPPVVVVNEEILSDLARVWQTPREISPA